MSSSARAFVCVSMLLGMTSGCADGGTTGDQTSAFGAAPDDAIGGGAGAGAGTPGTGGGQTAAPQPGAGTSGGGGAGDGAADLPAAGGAPGATGTGGDMAGVGDGGGTAAGGAGADDGSAGAPADGSGDAADTTDTGDVARTQPPPGMPCTGKPGATGDETRTHGLAQYIVHFPPGIDPNEPVPVIFVDHGFTMSGASMQSITNFDAVADREGFVVVYPNGDGGAFPWNVGVGACAPGGLISATGTDSIGYHEAMLASIEETQCVNRQQVFVTGFSMGGYFSHHMGCEAGNTFARAVGPHSGGTYPGDCASQPLPVFIMHGANDTFIDHNLCGKGARDYWIQRNGCDSQFESRSVSGGTCEWYSGCNENGETVYCEFAGVGHGWARGATDAVWDFFKSYL